MSKTTISAALRRIRKLKGQIAEDRATAAKVNNWMMGQEPPFRFHEIAEMSLQKAIKTLQEINGEIAWLKSLSCMPHASQNQEIEQKHSYGQAMAQPLGKARGKRNR